MKTRVISILILIITSLRINAQPPETIYQGNIAVNGYADNESYGPFNIGFNFTFFGNTYNQFYINSNGQVLFGAGSLESVNASIPTASAPNNFIAPFWDDLVVDSYGKILYTTIGAAPNRKLIVQFTNMGFYPYPVTLGSFSVILYETSNVIQTQYRLIVLTYSDKAHGGTATIGLENATGTSGVQYAFRNPGAVNSDKAISFTPIAGPSYSVNSNAIYDGVLLTTNLTVPDPQIPELISPPQDAVIGQDFTFEWEGGVNAASFMLYIGTNSELVGSTSYSVGSNLSYDITGLTLDQTYYWAVFATNSTGTTWCEIKRFTTSSAPPLVPVPLTAWVEQSQDTVIKLQYTGGDSSPKTVILTSLPAQGQLYQYYSGSRGDLISSVPATITGAGKNIIYAAPGSHGNGIGNFNFKINDVNGDSPEGTITINVISLQVPNVLYVAKSTGVEIQFDIPMADPTGKEIQFTVNVNGSPAIISSAALKAGDPNSIMLTLASPLAGTETVLVSYTQGSVSGLTGGLLLSFTDQTVTLKSQTITFPVIPGKKFGNPSFNPGATASSSLSITYSSSNLPVATSAGSLVTIQSAGTSKITARQAGNGTYAPAKFTQTLTVAKGDQTITFNSLPDKSTGDPDFSPGATASSGLAVSYSSDNTSVATIVAGMIHIVGEGTANITASQPGNVNYNPATDVSQPFTVSLSTGLKDPVISQNKFNIYLSGYNINIQPLSDEWNGKTGSVTVFNIIGNRVTILQKTEFNKNSLIQLDAPAMRGIYLVEMKSGEMRYVGKVIIR